MPNIEHFKDLSPEMQHKLLTYIKSHYTARKSINYNHSAYGLKQQFTRKASSLEHVTEQCFTEAMVSAGFSTKPDPSSGKSCFNIYVLKHPKEPIA